MADPGRRRLICWLPYLAFVAFNFAASSLTWGQIRRQAPFVRWVPQREGFKLRHIVQYGPQGVAALLAIEVTGAAYGLPAAVGALALVTADGAFEEAHQFFVPTRICSLRDVLWDTLGGLVGLLVFLGGRACLRRVKAGAGS